MKHTTRPEVLKHQPQHVTLPTVPEVGRLRKRDIYRAVQQASITSIGFSRSSGKCRICQISVQKNHIHLIVEADNKEALSRGIQGFEVSCAKRINAALTKRRGVKRRGPVFADRFHARALQTPREVRAALSYVLNNWRHHGEPITPFASGRIDPHSSGMHFSGWIDWEPIPIPEGAQFLGVWWPKEWLLKIGWERHGLISPFEIPGEGRETARS